MFNLWRKKTASESNGSGGQSGQGRTAPDLCFNNLRAESERLLVELKEKARPPEILVIEKDLTRPVFILLGLAIFFAGGLFWRYIVAPLNQPVYEAVEQAQVQPPIIEEPVVRNENPEPEEIPALVQPTPQSYRARGGKVVDTQNWARAPKVVRVQTIQSQKTQDTLSALAAQRIVQDSLALARQKAVQDSLGALAVQKIVEPTAQTEQREIVDDLPDDPPKIKRGRKKGGTWR